MKTRLDSQIGRWFNPHKEEELKGRLVRYGWYLDARTRTVEYVVVETEPEQALKDAVQVGVRIEPGLEELVFHADARGMCAIFVSVEKKGPVPLLRFLVNVEGERAIPLLLQYRDMLKRAT